MGFARGAIKVVEVDLIRAGVTADAISLAAGDAGVVVALGAISAMKAVGIVEASAIFVAVDDAIAAVAVDAITAGDAVSLAGIFCCFKITFVLLLLVFTWGCGGGGADGVLLPQQKLLPHSPQFQFWKLASRRSPSTVKETEKMS